MSYDVDLEVDLGGPQPSQIVNDGWNYTSNCAPMWRAAGADLAEFDGKLAQDCATILDKAIVELEGNAPKYREMNPVNGWGSYESLVPQLRVLQDIFDAHPRAIVRVSR